MNRIKLILILFTICIGFSESVRAYGWEERADFGGEPRHRTTALSIGNHVYAGLGHYNGAGPNILFDDWWEYDPATNAWSQKANYLGGPTYHAAAFVVNGKGYVGTGRIDIPFVQLVKDFYEYDPVTNTWTQIADFPGSGRRGSVGFSVGNYGYVGTGSYNSDFYRYDPSTGNWTPVASMPTQGRISAVAFSIGNYGYVGTGSAGGSTKDFWRYDPASNQWAQMANVGSINRTEASGFAQGGKGYILTGDNYSSGTNYKDMYEYDPASNTWVQLDDFPGSARRYMSSVTNNGVTYCGLGTSGTNYNDWWEFDRTANNDELDINNIELSVWPNPASKRINLTVKDELKTDNIAVEIVSINGAKIYTSSLLESSSIDISQFDNGTYFLKLIHNDNVLNSKKIIIHN